MRQPSVADLVSLRARAAGDRPALIVGADGRTMTSAELGALAEAWRAAVGDGARPWSHRAGLLIGDPLAFAATYLSLLAAGVTVAPMNPEAPADCARQAEAMDVDVVVTDSSDADAGGRPIWHLDGRPTHIDWPRRPDASWTAGPPAVILASSGTTGAPKVIPLAERQLLSVAGHIASHHRLGPDDRGYCSLPLFHVNAQVVGLLAALTAGGSLIIDRRFRRPGFWSLLDTWQATWVNAVPALLSLLADGPAPTEAAARRLRFARSASAPLPPAVQARFEEHTGVSVLESYGMTEACSQVTVNPLERARRRLGSVGLPVGHELRVVDEDGRPCQAGTVGSIEIRGRDVIDQYLGPGPGHPVRPARNAGGWLVTGDVGHRDEDGHVFVTGRTDDLINCGGEKIYPREIEDLLRAHPAVTQAVVLGQPHELLGQCPIAYVTVREGSAPNGLANALMRGCEASLGRSRRPRRVVIVDQIPAGPTGKVSRGQLELQVLGSRAAQ